MASWPELHGKSALTEFEPASPPPPRQRNSLKIISSNKTDHAKELDGGETTVPLTNDSSTSLQCQSDGTSRPNHAPYHLAVLPLDFSPPGDDQEVDKRKSARWTLGAVVPPKRPLACVDLDALGAEALQDAQLEQTTAVLAGMCLERNLAGLALRVSSCTNPKQVEKLLQRLSSSQVSALLLFHHDSWHILGSVGLKHAAGVVIENAVILPDGQRRDYFQAKGLRHITSKCAEERETRPDFFVGFLELWRQRPHPSIIRRAVKLADHFGAVVEHACSDPALGLDVCSVPANRTLSAFEYLKRPDVTKVSEADDSTPYASVVC